MHRIRMMTRIRVMTGTLVVSAVLHCGPHCGPASAQSRQAPVPTPAMQCRKAIERTEQVVKVPNHLLAAIGRVESGRWDASSGSWQPWPWIINVDGEDSVFETKAQAVAAVRTLQAHGVISIDVGCMQVNLMYHPNAFVSLDQAFDPPANVLYAARFLTELFERTNDWTQAAALYHSATPERAADYLRRVLAVWPEQTQIQEALAQAYKDRTNLAQAWAATLPGKPQPMQAAMFQPLHQAPHQVKSAAVLAAEPMQHGATPRQVELSLAAWRGGAAPGLARLHASD